MNYDIQKKKHSLAVYIHSAECNFFYNDIILQIVYNNNMINLCHKYQSIWDSLGQNYVDPRLTRVGYAKQAYVWPGTVKSLAAPSKWKSGQHMAGMERQQSRIPMVDTFGVGLGRILIDPSPPCAVYLILVQILCCSSSPWIQSVYPSQTLLSVLQ